MKNVLSTFCLLITVAVVSAQSQEPKSLLNDKKVFGKLKNSSTIFDLTYFSSDIKGVKMDGGGIVLGAVFNNVWMIGIDLSFTGTRSIRIDTIIPVVNPRYNYALYAIDNEFLICTKHVLNFSIPLKTGVGYARYFDKYSDNNNNNKTIADDAFFVAQGGIHVFVNIFKFLSIGGGASYRWATDVQEIGTNDDFRNFIYEGKLRFNFLNKNHPATTPKSESAL